MSKAIINYFSKFLEMEFKTSISKNSSCSLLNIEISGKKYHFKIEVEYGDENNIIYLQSPVHVLQFENAYYAYNTLINNLIKEFEVYVKTTYSMSYIVVPTSVYDNLYLYLHMFKGNIERKEICPKNYKWEITEVKMMKITKIKYGHVSDMISAYYGSLYVNIFGRTMTMHLAFKKPSIYMIELSSFMDEMMVVFGELGARVKPSVNNSGSFVIITADFTMNQDLTSQDILNMLCCRRILIPFGFTKLDREIEDDTDVADEIHVDENHVDEDDSCGEIIYNSDDDSDMIIENSRHISIKYGEMSEIIKRSREIKRKLGKIVFREEKFIKKRI